MSRQEPGGRHFHGIPHSWVPGAPQQAPGGNDDPASKLFDEFCGANTFQTIMSTFQQLCDVLELKPSDHRNFYKQLKNRLTSWKAQSLWSKLDKRAAHREYKKNQACPNTRVLIIGAGPVGLRTGIEIALLGGKAVVLEKRDRFSRNNVLHLWPFLIHDLKALGAKKFFGKFCAGAIDHISIRALQCILLKVALLVGVEVHPGTSFEGLVEPPENSEVGWKARVEPEDSHVSEFEFDVLVGADGKRNTLQGFQRKEFRGKLAIAITANFINRNTSAEAKVEEISGVAFIFNQKFFKDLFKKTGIDLENIVYYKDETHYFVMTAKKNSLLEKGVLVWDYMDTEKLLMKDNVNQDALMDYAREAADVSTSHLMPNLEYAHNHYGQPDVAMFDFTSIFQAEHASRVIERNGHKLLTTLVGDSLLEPFWPTGSGCARGFLGALDAAWMIRNWASGKMTPLEVMAERESIYQLLSQTTPENLSKNYSRYTIDPCTRYKTVNFRHFSPSQVRHQYDGGDQKYLDEIVKMSEQKSKKYDHIRDSHYLLKWFQRQLDPYKNQVRVFDLSTSWRNGIALCSLIHNFKPDLVNVYALDPNEVEKNNQMAFDIAEKEFGIIPVMSGQDMALSEEPDKLTMVSYLSQFYEFFRKEAMAAVVAKKSRSIEKSSENTLQPTTRKFRSPRPKSPSSKLTMLNNISNRIRARREKMLSSDEEDQEKAEERRPALMARKRVRGDDVQQESSVTLQSQQLIGDKQTADSSLRGLNKVSAMAKDLAIKFSAESAPPPAKKEAVENKGNQSERPSINRQMSITRQQYAAPKSLIVGSTAGSSDVCYFCEQRVYLVERHSAEGVFFHRGCLKCEYCGTNLRIGQYCFRREDDGTGKFYCYQHIGMKKPIRRMRKKSLEELQLAIPDYCTEPAPASPSSPDGGIESKLNKTPERIEYCTESEVEESEFDQTKHNLSTSLLDMGDNESNSDSDTDTDEDNDEIEWSDEELSDGETSWAQLARTYKRIQKQEVKKSERAMRRAARAAALGERAGDSSTDSETACESDDDWDTESETEKESEGEDSDEERKKKVIAEKRREAEKQKPSPGSMAIHSNRLSFFDNPTEPVRIDPWSFLGLPKQPPAAQSSPKGEPEEDEVMDADGKRKRVGEGSSGEETITEGSDSEDENSGVVQATHHPIPTIEVEEICVSDGDVTSEEEEEEGVRIEEEASSSMEAGDRRSTGTEGSEVQPVAQEGTEESYDQTVPSDSPLESTEPDSSILEDSSEILEPIPMDTRENQNDIVSLEESISEFDKIEKQYDMLQEELGFSLSSEPTSEEQKWISPQRGVKLDEQTSSSVTDLEATSSDSQAKGLHESSSGVAAKQETSDTAAETSAQTKEDIATTISKLTPTREIDLLKELELMEQEVSTMKKVVDEVEANVESRKAKIAELVDDTETGNVLSPEQTEEPVVKREKLTDEPVVARDQIVPEDIKPVEAQPSLKEVPLCKVDIHEHVATITGVTTSESNTDGYSEDNSAQALYIAGVTASESTTDFPSSESDMQVNDIMTKSLSQNFDLVSLQSLQDNVKLESYGMTDMVYDTKSKPVAKANKTDHQRPTNLGTEQLLTREAPLASVESEVDDDLMRTSSSNASPDDPVTLKDDDSKDIDEEEPDSTTSDSLLDTSVKSEVTNKRPYKSFKDSFPMHMSPVSHVVPEPPVLLPVPQPKKPQHVVPKPKPDISQPVVPEVKAAAATSKAKVVSAPKVQSEVKAVSAPKTQSVLETRKQTKANDSNSKETRDTKRKKHFTKKQAPLVAPVVSTLGEKLKVEKYDGRPSVNEHGLAPVQREKKEKRSKSPVNPEEVPSVSPGAGLQGIGEIVAAAARCRPKLGAKMEEDAIKRIDNLLNKARERREKRQGDAKAAAEPAEQDEAKGREPISPAASGASEPPRSPPVDARAAVEEHMEALDQLVRESQAAAGISVDESFVNTRDRKKRKRHQSNQSDSSFTISTPTGSIKSCSSISEIESTPASLDKSNSNDLLGSSTDADVSLSIEQLLDDNSTMDDSHAPRSAEVTVITDTTLERSPIGSSQRDSLQYVSADTSVNDNSEYFTPNVSGVEPMDINEAVKSSPKIINRPKALDSRSTASDGKSLDSLDDSHSSPLYSPRRNLVDAKRNFFFEPAKPVTIDPSRVFNSPTHKSKKGYKNDNGRKDQDGNAIEVGPEEFENEKNANNTKHHQSSSSKKKISADPELIREWKSQDSRESPKKGVKGLDLKRDWQSLDCGSATSPTAGIPKTNVTNGDSDVFYTPGTSLKHPPIAEICADNGLKKPSDAKKRILPEDRESARQAAREKARLKSDEELGLEQLSPTRKAAYTKDDISKQTVNGLGESSAKGTKGQKASAQDSSTKRSSGLFDHYPPLEPEIPCKVSVIGGSMHEAKTRSLQNKATAAAMADYLQSRQSPQSKAMKEKRSKSKSPMRAAAEMAQSPPHNLQKQNSKEDKRDNKEKRRSLLAMLLPSKSVDKKDKKTEKKSTPKQSKSKSPPVKKQETKSKGIKSPKTSTSPKVPSVSEQPKKGSDTQDGAGQRTSVYEEYGPVFEENAFGESKEGKPESKKEKLMERIEQIAPIVSNDNTVAPKLPPKATVDEFDTESELGDGDRISLRSYQSSQQLTEEDLAKLLKKQQRAAQRRQREQELKRLRMAQEIQRQLEEVEIKQRDVEKRGVSIERALRGDGSEANRAEADLMQEWFNVVHEKNVLVRYESELMVHARELELEDRHARLEHKLREVMTKTGVDRKEEEQRILEELLEVVEQRDALVALLEEDRQKEREQDQEIRNIMSKKGFQLSPTTYTSRLQSPLHRNSPEGDVG